MIIGSGILTLVLLLVGVPVFLAFATFGIWVSIYELQIPWATIGITMFAAVNKHVLQAIPLFILAAYLMLETGLSTRLVNFFSAFIGHFKGGLAMVMIITMGFFGAINGSILAAIIAIGGVMLPTMEKKGYSRPLIAALAAGSAGLDSLIPPSNGAIVFASVTEASVSQLFAATILPGIIQMIMLMAVCAYLARHLPTVEKATWKQRGQATLQAGTALLLPVIILGGIFGGIFTAVEAAAVACIYSIMVGALIHRSVTWTKLWSALKQTASITAVIFIVIAAASTFSTILIYTQFPQTVQRAAVDYGVTPMGLLLMGNAGCLLLGTFLEAIPNILVSASILAPAAKALGIPITQLWGTVGIAVALGLLTPPVCVGAYTAAGMANVRPADVFRHLYPWIFLTLIISLALAIFVPPLTTWLPSLIKPL